MENRDEEIRRLRGCLNDLVSVLALPALWSGHDASQIINTLLEGLVGMLRLDFAYARLSDAVAGSSSQMLRLAQHRNPAAHLYEVDRALQRWLTVEPSTSPLVVPNPVGEGEITIVCFRLGLQNETGVLVAGSQRADFPTKIEMLLLRVATNQAVIGLQEERRLHEQKHAAQELEQRVAERTRQLTSVNQELRKEMAERKRAEAALQKAFNEIKILKDKLAQEKLYLEEEIRAEQGFEEIIGVSVALKQILKQVEIVAPTGSTVLIQGETGTGKELIARAIHNRSKRRERTFIKINCAAIPTGLLESELFGHEKGAFTGAIAQRIGRFELANQGTIFLDEVGEIPPELQAKLLRVLQEQEFERLGSTRTIRVDVRLIAASNRDLAQMVAQREFRSDLYYRLKVFPITAPALRDRVEDIPLLVRYFTELYARQFNKPIISISSETMAALSLYPWPGNVRELENFIERSVILSPGSTLEAPVDELRPFNGAAAEMKVVTLEGVEREHILRALNECNWVIAGPSGAAAKLGMKRTSLQYKMQKLGITRPR